MMTRYEYGFKIDCARNGCDPVHSDDGRVYPDSTLHEGSPEITEGMRVNNHQVTIVKRTVVYGDWRKAP